MQIFSSPHTASKLLLGAHIHNLQRRIRQLNHMSRFPCLGVNVIDIMWVKNPRFRAIENSLFTRRVSEAETAPTT